MKEEIKKLAEEINKLADKVNEYDRENRTFIGRKGLRSYLKECVGYLAHAKVELELASDKLEEDNY